MSEFNKYARKLDEIARAAFAESKTAAARLERANQARIKPESSPNQHVDAVAAERAKLEYLEMEQAAREVRRKMDEGEYRQQINATRKELAAAVDEAFRVNPEQIDSATLELLKSGICTPDEYGALLKKAASEGNVTMCRLIGKYANDAATAAQEAAGGYVGDQTASALRAVVYQSRNYNGKQWLDAFDYMTDVYNRACRNPGMIDAWDKLTAETVEKF